MSINVNTRNHAYILSGCFPSKVLIGCARRAHEVRTASEFGVKIPEGEVTVDFGFVMERMRRLRAEIGSEVDSVARYVKAGIPPAIPNDACARTWARSPSRNSRPYRL